MITQHGNNSIDSILTKSRFSIDIDVMIIDIDGQDYYIFESLTKFQVKIIAIEFNPTIPNDVLFVQENNPKNMHGASAKSLIELAKSKGYELFSVTHCNCFFIHKSFFHHLNIIDNSLLTLRKDYSRVCSIFFGYDGTIFLRGNTRNPWTGLNLYEDEVQIIPYWINTFFKGRMVKRIYRVYRLITSPRIVIVKLFKKIINICFTRSNIA